MLKKHFMTTLDQYKDKIKGVAEGENLLEVPEDGRFDTIPMYFQERSAILIELQKQSILVL